MLDEKVDLVAGDFNGAAWRRTIWASKLSIIGEAVADCDLPLPLGPTQLWGPGAVRGTWSDVCGFIKPPDSSERWRVRQHGAFPVRHEALGIGQTDQGCHHEVWLHLDFVDRCARATNSLERTFSAVPLQQTERSHKRGCQGPFAFFVILRPLAASLGSALRTTRATCCDLNKTISNRLDETQIFYCDSRVCFVSFIVIDRMLSMHDHLNTRATTKKKRRSSERGRPCASTIQSTERARTNRTRNDASSVSQLVQMWHHGKGLRRGLEIVA